MKEETVEGFTVFKNSKSASVENEQAKKESSQEKKKLNRQLEVPLWLP